MMVVGVLILVVAERGSVTLGGLNSAAAGLGTAAAGPLLGAAVDRFGQRRVLVPVGLLNAGLLGSFPLVVGSVASNAALLALSVLIGATAPQVAPLSRTRLVAIIRRLIEPDRQEKTRNGTMAVESAADETVFIVGPFLVGLLATAVAPWLAVAGAAALTLVFVTRFPLHPTGRLDLGRKTGTPRVQARVRELLRAPLVTVVVGTLGVGLFFGATLTSLLAADGDGDSAGLLYGVMHHGHRIGRSRPRVSRLPRPFPVRMRWLVFGAVLLAAAFAAARSVPALVVALAVAGCGIGPTLVAQYSLGASALPRRPVGRPRR